MFSVGRILEIPSTLACSREAGLMALMPEIESCAIWVVVFISWVSFVKELIAAEIPIMAERNTASMS